MSSVARASWTTSLSAFRGTSTGRTLPLGRSTDDAHRSSLRNSVTLPASAPTAHMLVERIGLSDARLEIGIGLVGKHAARPESLRAIGGDQPKPGPDLEQVLSPGDVVLEVGAGLGLVSAYCRFAQ